MHGPMYLWSNHGALSYDLKVRLSAKLFHLIVFSIENIFSDHFRNNIICSRVGSPCNFAELLRPQEPAD